MESHTCFKPDSDYSFGVESDEDTALKEIKMKQMATLPWIEKYRPTDLGDIVSQDETIGTLRKFIAGNCLPHLLFYGPPGTGKTSTITACAKEIYGEYVDVMVMELNASDDRGIEVVRNKIKKFVASQSVFFGESAEERSDIFKLVILDETDAMTDDAQAILRKVVEEYTKNARFCLICNYIQKIKPALQSRCTQFRFSPLHKNKIRKLIVDVAKKEDVKITKTGIDTLIKRSNGDMRKILNTLQSVSMSYPTINEKIINKCMGYPQRQDMTNVFDSLCHSEFSEVYAYILGIVRNGLSLSDIIHEIHDIIVDYILSNKTDGTCVDEFTIEQLSMILDKLREIEYSQAINTTENIQIGALIGLFKVM